MVGETASPAPPGFLRFSVAGCVMGVIAVGVGAAAGVAADGPGVDPDAWDWCGVACSGFGVPFMAAGLSTCGTSGCPSPDGPGKSVDDVPWNSLGPAIPTPPFCGR